MTSQDANTALGVKNNSKGPRIKVKFGAQTKYFNWLYFQNNRETIFDSFLVNSVGKWKVEMWAYDYGDNPAYCWTWIRVRDCNRPKSDKKCPSHLFFSNGKATAPYTKANVARGIRIMQKYKLWKDCRKNDKCTPRWWRDALPQCKRPKWKRTTFCNPPWTQSIPGIGNYPKCFRINGFDLKFMKRHLAQRILKTTHPRPGHPSWCKKCCHFKHTFSELFTNFQCNANQQRARCAYGEGCEVKRCLQANEHTFFKAKVFIAKATKRHSRAVIREFLTEGYDADHEIHVALPHKCRRPSSRCAFREKIKVMFYETRTFRNSAIASTFPANTNPRHLVKFRYKVGSGPWRPFYRNAKEKFQSLVTIITFQAWSVCGKICEYKVPVYLHCHTDLKLCENFAANSLFQSSRFQPNRVNTQFCAYPFSDFGELTFRYSPGAKFLTQSKQHPMQLRYRFKRLKCEMCFGKKGKKCSKPVTTVNYNKHQPFLKRYAVILAKQPTCPTTPVYWKCTISYLPFGKHKKAHIETEHCEHSFEFKDCEDPKWDCPWGACLLKCKKRQPNRALPNQVCAGTTLEWDPQGKAPTGCAKMRNRKRKCCDKCGDPGQTVCESIFPGPGDVQGTICKCTIKRNKKYKADLAAQLQQAANQNTKPSLLIMDESNRSMVLAVGSMLLAAVAATVFAVVRTRLNVVTNAPVQTPDGYSPLL